MSKINIITAIDIGTNSIKFLVGQKKKDSPKIDLIAKEEAFHSVGVRKGEIYDPKKISQSILKLKNKIQESKGIKIRKAIVSINGPHISNIKSQGLVSVSRADQKISKEDIQRVIRAAQAISLPPNKKILEVIPQEFIIDGEKGIKNPLGLQGIRLEVKVLLICVFSPVLENLENAVLDAGIEIEEIIPSITAFPQGVLNSEQKELGVAVVNIGAGTTSLTVFQEGVLKDFNIFPLGSANITNDIALGLRTEIKIAERIKKEFASLKRSSKSKKDKIEIPEAGLSFPKTFLQNIVKMRVSEIFSEISKSLNKISKETVLPAGVVLTGGGSLLPGIVPFAKDKFKLPCQISGPKGIPGLEDAQFSTCAGLFFQDESNNSEEIGAKEGLKEKFKKVIRIFLP